MIPAAEKACGHTDATAFKYSVDIKKSTLKMNPHQEDPTKFFVEFTYDAHVAGRCMLYFSEICAEGFDESPTLKQLIPPIEVDLQQDLRQKSKTAVDLSVCKNGLADVYHLAIKTHATSEDGSTTRVITVTESTLAVFQIDKGKCKVRVTNQFIDVNGVKFLLYTISGISNPNRECILCLSRERDARELNIGKLRIPDIKNEKVRDGAVVLEGRYDGREADVKKVPIANCDLAVRETHALRESDQNSNIIRLWGVEEKDDFIYIALERCVCSVRDLIESRANPSANLHPAVEVFKDLKLWGDDKRPLPQLLDLMREIVEGLAYLHKLGIIHGDLKLENVFTQKVMTSFIKVKLSGMGINKHLPSSTKNTAGCGTLAEDQTNADDLFSLGCVLFFIITGGKHPFGEMRDREKNILEDKKDLSLLRTMPEAEDLISRLLDPDPNRRPTAEEVLTHPLFWKPKKRLSFLLAAYNRVKYAGISSKIRKSLESNAQDVVGDNWFISLDIELRKDIEDRHADIERKNKNKSRKRKRSVDVDEDDKEYTFDSVRELLRLIRNKYHHKIRGQQHELHDVPMGFESYFDKRFFKLVIHVYNALKDFRRGGKEEFRRFFTFG